MTATRDLLLTIDDIQSELDKVMEKLRTLPGYCQIPEDRAVLDRMYQLVDLRKAVIVVDERGNCVEICGCIEAVVLDSGHYCDPDRSGGL